MSRSNSASAIAPLARAITSFSGTPAAAQRSGSRLHSSGRVQGTALNPQPDRNGHLPPGQRQRDQRLAVGAFAELATVLPRHAHRLLAFFEKPCLINDQDCLRLPQVLNPIGAHIIPASLVITPGTPQQMLHAIGGRIAVDFR